MCNTDPSKIDLIFEVLFPYLMNYNKVQHWVHRDFKLSPILLVNTDKGAFCSTD